MTTKDAEGPSSPRPRGFGHRLLGCPVRFSPMPMFPQKPLPVPYAAAWAREGSSRQGWTGGICLGWTERENPGAPLAPDGQAGLAMSDTREMALDGVMCGCMGLFSVCGCGGVARNYGPPKQKGGGGGLPGATQLHPQAKKTDLTGFGCQHWGPGSLWSADRRAVRGAAAA